MLNYKYPVKIIDGIANIKGEETHIHIYGNDIEGFEAYVAYIENDIEVIVNNIIGTWQDIRALIKELDPYGTEIEFTIFE